MIQVIRTFSMLALTTGMITACATDDKKTEMNAEDAQVSAALDKMEEPKAAPEMAAPTDQAPEPKAEAKKTAWVKTYALNVRSGPGVSHPVVSHLAFGSQVEIMEAGQWTKVGENMFVYGEYIAMEKPETPMMVQTASTMPVADESEAEAPAAAPAKAAAEKAKPALKKAKPAAKKPAAPAKL